MKDPVTPLVAAAPLCVAASFCPPPAAGAAARPPVVVELFTSQGCSSCPPADALLGELARRDDVLALSFHVTYWDRLGWPDTFGLAASTARQNDYARWMGQGRVYTPQMVIGGRLDVVGSARRGQPLELRPPLDRFRGAGRASAAILLQQRGDGAILTAARLDLAAR